METSAVSRGVRELEERVGLSIFERSHRGVTTSAAGVIYLGGVREALDLLERVEATARSVGAGKSGLLRIGFVWSFAFGPIVRLLEEMRRVQPEIEVQLVEDGPDQLIARLHDGKLDVVLTAIEPEGHVPSRPIGQVSRLTLWNERLLAALPASEGKAAVSWGDLAEQKLLCRHADDFRGFTAFIESTGGPTLRFFPQDCSREGLLGFVAAGHGWTIVPESLRECDVHGIALIPIDSANAALRVELLWRSESNNPAVHAFIKLAKKMRTRPGFSPGA
ncbi:LysR family transcriptional regulator [Sphingosinicella rhizophila]|uniref:LysR substrate-binding domain-containing protein n=1 Tax=Sphingosinicella rhizophila TaxID=3050082 RepID=A0ABU3QAG0_9SPHN|nr:LysR substrate-binding domain-containing protein [Sphingosinicella sp. GR2756]MDT9600395.1 LysR substrate-binding domain-containing protein [Sphingosinicella sp. GR2756]